MLNQIVINSNIDDVKLDAVPVQIVILSACGQLQEINFASSIIDELVEKLQEFKISLEPKSEVKDIFDHWVIVMNKGSRAKLTPSRRTKIKARLKEGYPQSDIIRAIDNCALNPWNMGENPNGNLYNDLTLICRNGDKLEFYRDSIKAVITHQDLNDKKISDWIDEGLAQTGEIYDQEEDEDDDE
jgi:hypothetical protein